MSKQLVQVCLPGPASSVHATFIDLSASINQLVKQLLEEDGPQIRRTICGRGTVIEGEIDLDQWMVQRVIKSGQNRDWTEEELEGLDQGAHTSLSDPLLASY